MSQNYKKKDQHCEWYSVYGVCLFVCLFAEEMITGKLFDRKISWAHTCTVLTSSRSPLEIRLMIKHFHRHFIAESVSCQLVFLPESTHVSTAIYTDTKMPSVYFLIKGSSIWLANPRKCKSGGVLERTFSRVWYKASPKREKVKVRILRFV